MKPEIWKRAKEILPEVRELPLAERGAFLDRACGDDPELRREIESFLTTDPEVLAFIDRPPIRLLGEGDGFQEGEDRQLGAYRILRRLGSGGMGIVYLATRVGDEFTREVAIKVLPPERTSEEAEQRFLQEMGILAKLNHPNIAKLHEGGRTDDGRLYYLMEYVEGQPIDDYCREWKLSLEERLRLFQRVAVAVQYAHTQLIIHRDIKPSNVLVTDEGEPKLLDFGVGKPLEGAGIGAPVVTGGGQRLFTPDYASPEQLAGEDIHTASDVYSLGVLLYELLAGDRPFPVPHEREIQRQARTGRLVPPSAAVSRQAEATTTEGTPTKDPTTAGFRRKLEGDLDTIVLKALREEPEQRYASVEQLADDLRRYREGHPIRARRPTMRYRAGKYLRRNAVWVGLAALFLLVVGIATVALFRQHQETVRERDLAHQERERAEELNAFLESIFHGANPYQNPGAPPTVFELLERGTERVLTDTGLRPDVRGNILYTLSTISMRIGEYETAQEQIEAAIPILRQEFGQVSIHHSNALSLLALLRQHQGDFRAAKELFEQALDTLPHESATLPALATLYNNLGRLLTSLGQVEEAQELYERSRAVYETNDLTGDAGYSVVLNNLAGAYSLSRKYAKAEPLYQRVLLLQRESLGANHPRVAITLNDVGELYRRMEQFTKAEEAYRESAKIYEDNHGPEFPHIGVVLANLGLAQERQEKYVEALESSERALVIFEKALGKDHPNYATTLLTKASLLLRTQQPQQAESLARQALGTLTQTYPEGHRAIARTQGVLGGSLVEQGQFTEAEELLLRAAETLETQHRPNDRALLRVRGFLSELYRVWDKSGSRNDRY